MVLALALPVDFPRRALLIDMTFGVVIASLLILGLTIPLIAVRLPGLRPHAAPAANTASERAADGFA